MTCNKSQIFLLLEVFFIKQELPINRQIKAREVQLIGENGEKLGVISFNEALEKAEEKNRKIKRKSKEKEAEKIDDARLIWYNIPKIIIIYNITIKE